MFSFIFFSSKLSSEIINNDLYTIKCQILSFPQSSSASIVKIESSAKFCNFLAQEIRSMVIEFKYIDYLNIYVFS